MRIPFGTNAYRLRDLPLSAQDLVNYYVEPAPPQAKTYAAVIPINGIAEFAILPGGYLRGAQCIRGILYVVAGQTLYRVLKDGSYTALGSIPGGKFCAIRGDEVNVMVLTQHRGYAYNGSTVLPITSDGFPEADWLEEMDGYYIVGVEGTGEFAISANRDPTTWDAIDFESTERNPDDQVAGIILGNELWVFCTDTFQVFDDTGATDFPFAAVTNGLGDVGIISRFALCKADSSIFFAGNDGVFYRTDGYGKQRISTPAIEQALQDAPDKTCYAMTWNEGGHKFVSFTFDNQTFVYDILTQLWHRRQSYGLKRWRPLFLVRAYDQWITGDFYSNVLGTLDPTVFSEFGHILAGSATSPPVSDDNKRMDHPRLELVFRQGVGTLTGQGIDPQVMLRWSDDGGRKWSSEYWRPIGQQGHNKDRAIWSRLGQARDRVYQYTITDPVPRTLILATTEAASTVY